MKNKCIKFKNSVGDKPQELYFYGDIVSNDEAKDTCEDICPQDIMDILKLIDETKPLDIYINSCGGNVFAGLAIYNMLKRNKSKKTVYVDGLAGSIASVIAMAGDNIIIPSNAFIAIHKPMGSIDGNATDLLKAITSFDKMQESIMSIYATKLAKGCNIKTVEDMVNAETWIVGSEASKYFDVTVVDAIKAVAKVTTLEVYNKIPKQFLNDTSLSDAGCQCGNCTNSCCVNCCGNTGDASNESIIPIKECNNKIEDIVLAKLKLQLENLY